MTASLTQPIELILVYCGHGTQQASQDDSEDDGLDEGILSVDNMFISDNELRRLVIDSLGESSRCLSIFDCCHSSTILDLPVTVEFDGRGDALVNRKTGESFRGKQSGRGVRNMQANSKLALGAMAGAALWALGQKTRSTSSTMSTQLTSLSNPIVIVLVLIVLMMLLGRNKKSYSTLKNAVDARFINLSACKDS